MYEVVNANIIIKKKKEAPLEALRENEIDGGIRGRVTNADGEPVANASVMITELNRGTAAANDGTFTFSNIDAGEYTLQVSAVGFATETRKVTVEDNDVAMANVQLALDNGNLSEVTVTALGIRRE